MLQVHQRLGDYEIVRPLGKGGMGEVYEAQQFSPRRRVALKVLAPWLSADPDALRRFWREAEVPAQLDHPNIVRIIATGQTEDGIAYYTMQLVRGVSLAEMIRRTRETPPPTVSHCQSAEETPSLAQAEPESADFALSPYGEGTPPLGREYLHNRYRAVARIGAAVARALAFAHQQGFVHRDLKPSNLMVDHHDQVYVVDFGLTRALEGDGLGSLSGLLTGTPSYMSPEQADGKPVEPPSDIYSLGVTLYELVTRGISPYGADRHNKLAVLGRIRAGQQMPLRGVAADVPAPLERIILKAMSFRPELRYADGAQLAADLEHFLHGSVDMPPVRDASRKRVKRTVLIATAVALLAIVGLFCYWDKLLGVTETSGEGVAPTPAPAPIQARNEPSADKPALPHILVERPWRMPINLFTRLPVEPLWAKQLADPGTYFPAPEQLNLATTTRGARYLLALDDDPQRRWFEFSVEMMTIPTAPRGMNHLGAFIGWHAEPVDRGARINPYLSVDLDKEHRQFRIRCHYTIKAAREGEGSVGGTISPPAPQESVALSRPGPWHCVRIRVVDNRITVIADEAEAVEIDPTRLQTVNAVFGSLNPRGALGIWTSSDAAFRNAQITALPAGNAP
jgi:serine/threonine protein kinase